jgi:hypothetical protein
MLERGVAKKFLKRLTKRQELCLKLFKPKKYQVYLKALDREYRQMISYYVKSNSYYHKLILSEISSYSYEIE